MSAFTRADMSVSYAAVLETSVAGWGDLTSAAVAIITGGGCLIEVTAVLEMLARIDRGEATVAGLRHALATIPDALNTAGYCCGTCMSNEERYLNAVADYEQAKVDYAAGMVGVTEVTHPFRVSNSGMVHTVGCSTTGPDGIGDMATLTEFTHGGSTWETPYPRYTADELAQWMVHRRQVHPRANPQPPRCKRCQPALPLPYQSVAV